MKNKFVFWAISLVFFIIYFKIFKFFLADIFPISPVANVISIFILIVVNIPVSVYSAERILAIIKKVI